MVLAGEILKHYCVGHESADFVSQLFMQLSKRGNLLLQDDDFFFP